MEQAAFGIQLQMLHPGIPGALRNVPGIPGLHCLNRCPRQTETFRALLDQLSHHTMDVGFIFHRDYIDMPQGIRVIFGHVNRDNRQMVPGSSASHTSSSQISTILPSRKDPVKKREIPDASSRSPT